MAPPSLKSFILDLMYPAVLGSFIVLLFIHFAESGIESVLEPRTHFGIILAIYYVFGFLSSKLIDDYKTTIAILDLVSSMLIFVCYYILGFDGSLKGAIGLVSPDYTTLYMMLMIVSISPPLRRYLEFETSRRSLDRRSLMSAAALVTALFGLANTCGWSAFAWATPLLIVLILYAILVWYIFDVSARGLRIGPKPSPADKA